MLHLWLSLFTLLGFPFHVKRKNTLHFSNIHYPSPELFLIIHTPHPIDVSLTPSRPSSTLHSSNYFANTCARTSCSNTHKTPSTPHPPNAAASYKNSSPDAHTSGKARPPWRADCPLLRRSHSLPPNPLQPPVWRLQPAPGTSAGRVSRRWW